MSAHFASHSVRPLHGLTLDPYLSVDEFRMSAPTFPPHPHAGFSAVTYMLPDSTGSFINRDSRGDRSRIEPGALHWTRAARGMMHEEIPEVNGVECHGLQIFVNLRAGHKREEPLAIHMAADEVPEVREEGGALVRVLAGDFKGTASPIQERLLTKVFLFHVVLPAHAAIAIPAPATQTAFLLALEGAGQVSPDDPRTIPGQTAVGLAADGDEIHIRAGANGFQVVACGGPPIAEPVVFGGPFAMTTEAEIHEAFSRFKRGEMGRLEPSA